MFFDIVEFPEAFVLLEGLYRYKNKKFMEDSLNAITIYIPINTQDAQNNGFVWPRVWPEYTIILEYLKCIILIKLWKKIVSTVNYTCKRHFFYAMCKSKIMSCYTSYSGTAPNILLNMSI